MKKTAEIYEKYVDKVTCDYPENIKIKDGQPRPTGQRTKKRDKFLFKGIGKGHDPCLIEVPLDVLPIEFEAIRPQNEQSVIEVEENCKKHGLDYCVADHGGKSPYLYLFNIHGVPKNQLLEAKKKITEILVPSKYYSLLDKTNIGSTLIPIIGLPHWKPKYKGAIHKIVRGKFPTEHDNDISKLITKIDAQPTIIVPKTEETDPICQKIKEKIKLSDVLREFVPNGAEQYPVGNKSNWLCPFCNDVNCFQYSDSEGIYHCFNSDCLKAGNVFHLIQEFTKCNFLEAKALLLKRFDIDAVDLGVYTDQDLVNYTPKKNEWIIENQIPKEEVGLIVGRRGERKTFTALYQAITAAAGLKCLEDASPQKVKVLFIDEESGMNQIATRVKLIKKGLGIEKDVLDIRYMSFGGLKLDAPKESPKLKAFLKLIDEFKPNLIILDCLARAVTFEIDKDNAAISALFTETVRPLIKKYGMSWLFIHHVRKGLNGVSKSEDPLDDVRGGSELTNYCRFVLMCQSPRGQIKADDGTQHIIFKVLKMSNSERPEPKMIAFTPIDDGLKICYAGKPEDVVSSEVQAAAKIKSYLIENGITEVFTTGKINEASDVIGFKKTLLSSGLNILLKDKFLEKIKKGQWKMAATELPKITKIEQIKKKLRDRNIPIKKPFHKDVLTSLGITKKQIDDWISDGTLDDRSNGEVLFP